VRAIRWILAAGLAAAGLGTAGSAAAQECPTRTFLGYGQMVYGDESIPSMRTLSTAEAIGTGTLDEPTSPDGCERSRTEVSVLRIEGIDPRLAVAVADRPGTIFVLGARCGGYAEDERLDCLLGTLAYGETIYSGARYPEEAEAPALTFGEGLGDGELAGEPAPVVELAGVAPAVAVGVVGRPGEAFVALGACPYEQFAADEERDDLSRCLEGPVWLVFDPVGGEVGATVTARADRALRPELEGATVALARLDVAADVVPDDLTRAVPIGALDGADLTFTVPELEQGIYEAVVTCDACAPAFGGRSVFPAGSLVVFEGDQGGGIPRWVAVLIGVMFLVLLAASAVLWRKGYRGRRSRPAGQ
jgi:hypothetical protein